jgi:hypothetical protein
MPSRTKLSLIMGIDVSGQPYNSIYVGLTSINMEKLHKIEKDFKKKFPRIFRKKQKGSKLNKSELRNVISFLDDNMIYMKSTIIKTADWHNFFQEYRNKAHLTEKVYSLLYFQLISKNCFKYTSHPYSVTVCKENNININKVLLYVNYLLKSNGYNVILSIGYANSNTVIKLADFVAAARRKLEDKFLKALINFDMFHSKDIHYKYIERIFKK